MPPSSNVFRVGTRPSRLALGQAEEVVGHLRSWLPGLAFEVVARSSPGDRDRTTDLREAPPDFFTRDLDESLRQGTLDLAVHSAKDLPEPFPEDLDWFWLPWQADPRDVLVLRPGMAVADLPTGPVVGVSSARRADYAQRRFPDARMIPLRGHIEERLRQLDEGRCDVLVMAAAALQRLGLLERATEWISLADLPVPEGQGRLAATYCRGDRRLNRLRTLFVKPVRFVSAGAGNARHCTLAGRQALASAQVCLHDTLMDPSLLDWLPPTARRLDVGKRCGEHRTGQDEIGRWLLDEARRGLRVVRLKGGDAGLFGRLAEELEALERLELPYEILPGVSSLAAATTGTGLLLTRRGVSRGFCALTPRGAGGTTEPFDAAARAALPVALFMALQMASEVADRLQAEGMAPETPAAIVLEAGGDAEQVIRTTLAGLGQAAAAAPPGAAGLLLVGEICRHGRQADGALQGARVLLTCSDDLQERAALAVADAGGVPLRLPMLRLETRPEAAEILRGIATFDWVAVTSPAAARCLLQSLAEIGGDLRRVPRLMACGPGTAQVLRHAGLIPDLVPEDDFGSVGLAHAASGQMMPGQRVLRLRSDKAGPALADALRALGVEVTDGILYANRPRHHETCPPFDIAFFASASAVESFHDQGLFPRLDSARVLVIGEPTARAVAQAGGRVDLVGTPATVDGAIATLARHHVAACLLGHGPETPNAQGGIRQTELAPTPHTTPCPEDEHDAKPRAM